MRTGYIVRVLARAALTAATALAFDAKSIGAPHAGAQEELGTRFPKGAHDVVPPDEREALGLNEAAWASAGAKVHSGVYQALEKAEKVTEAWRDPIGYAGTVYVQVQLKHQQKGKPDSPENKTAIRQLQSKVLSGLTAAEFYVEYPFQTLPGILGYASRKGLEKLKVGADVLAVCLDDRPFPKRPPHVHEADLPALRPGDPSTQPAQGRFWGSGGKVEIAPAGWPHPSGRSARSA